MTRDHGTTIFEKSFVLSKHDSQINLHGQVFKLLRSSKDKGERRERSLAESSTQLAHVVHNSPHDWLALNFQGDAQLLYSEVCTY